MELIETINKRRSIRRYKTKEVSSDIIEDLISYARLAPSAKNRQPWKFVITKDKVKNEIADIMLKKLHNTDSSVKATANIVKQAPILILVFKPKENNWLIGDTLSVGAAIEHICLRATDLGLGSLWIRDIRHRKKEISKLTGKDNLELISAITIGYPDENPNQRPRKKLTEILEWYKNE